MPTPTLHFTLAEFHRHIARTRTAMQDRGIDTLIVSDPSNMNWLTGYDGWSFYVRDLADGGFIPGHRRFVETLRANLKNDPEFELVRLSDGNAVRRRSLV